jgi:hypothetical protein
MQESTLSIPAKSRIPAKSIALPLEHGAWGFLFEPLLAGLLIAPTVSGAFISIFILGAFLCRQPLKFVVGDLLNGKRLPRTAVAVRWLTYFSTIAAFGALGIYFTAEPRSLIPLVLSAPVAIYLIYQDASRKSREMLPELLGASVLAGSIASLTLAAGHSYLFAAAMWLTMLARLIPSIVYVRNRLRLEKGKERSIFLPFAAHVVAILVLGVLLFYGFGSVLTIVVATFLLGRAVTGLSATRNKQTAKQLGVREVIYGVIYALSVVIGFYLGI